MKLADAADQMTLPSISTTPAPPPSDVQKPHPSADAIQIFPEESYQNPEFEAGNQRIQSSSETVLPASVCGIASPSTFHWKQVEVDDGKNEDRSLSTIESGVHQGEEVKSKLDGELLYLILLLLILLLHLILFPSGF